MTQTASIRKLPAPSLQGWALDFPQAGAAPRVSERGLYLQGWVLAQPGLICSAVAVRTDAGEDGPVKEIAFNNARPDVIRRVLGAAPEGHPQLRCGFVVHLNPVPAAFALGVVVDGETHWLCEVVFDGTPVAPVAPAAPSTQLIQGAGGWLYLDNDTNHSVDQFTGRLTLDAAGIEGWRRYLDDCAAIVRDTDARHAVLIAASKEQVLPEYYPHAKGILTVHEQVLGLCLPEHKVLDTAALLRARADREKCFIRTDTHWTDRGAMYAALALVAQLGLDEATARQCWAGDVYYTMPFTGDLGGKLAPPLSAPTEFLQAPTVTTKAQFDNHLPNIGRVLVLGCGDAPFAGSLLLFGASSSYPMLKYLKRLFQRIVFVHSAGNVDQAIVRQEQPAWLVMQTTARFMISPPNTGFNLAAAVAHKMQDVDASVRARADAAAADTDERNRPYADMLASR